MKKKAESDSEIEAVRVFFVKGVEYDSRAGLPWGVTQEQFDKKNAAWSDTKLANGEYSGEIPGKARAKADKRKEQRARAHVRKGTQPRPREDQQTADTRAPGHIAHLQREAALHATC